MKFTEALEAIVNTKQKMFRKDWGYILYFDRHNGWLVIDDTKMELSAYTPSIYDFEYDWEVKE
jgi:hypothetical protein